MPSPSAPPSPPSPPPSAPAPSAQSAPPAGPPPAGAGFAPADLLLLATLRRHDQALRAVLCTLARHGVALRRDAPGRSAAWLDALSAHPVFKGGQFLFDLLEWEDFMLDGDAPPALDGPAVQQALDRLAAGLRSLAAGLGAPAGVPLTIDIDATAAPGHALPALEAGFYLYHDVVLGALALCTGQAGG